MIEDTSLQEINQSIRMLLAAFQSLEELLRTGTEGAEDRKETFLEILGGLANRMDRAVEIMERQASLGDRLVRCETMLEMLIARQVRQQERQGSLQDGVERLIALLETPLEDED